MSIEDTLISKLIEETCAETLDKDQIIPVEDLRHYFEKKLNEVDFRSLNDYLRFNQLNAESMTLIQAIGCYRVVLQDAVLDFPKNWSIFEHIESHNVLFVDSCNDQDFLLDLFGELVGQGYTLAITQEDNEVQMIFLPEKTSLEHLSWIRNYFEKKSEEQDIKKAA